jgi:hypothetical protein
MNPTLKLAVLKTINEAIANKHFEDDAERVRDDINRDWWRGQKHQSWKLVPARDLIVVWNTYAKYGRIDSEKLENIWNSVKDSTLKVLVNSDITSGYDPSFFGKDDYDEITAKDWKRWAVFISDNSRTKWGRGSIDWDGKGIGRYSDASKHLYKLLEKGYSATTDEELLVAVDQILNFVHGSGAMAKWFVEGGTMTLSKLRDMDVKGIIIPGKLTENTKRFLKESLDFLKEIDVENIPRRFKDKGGYSVSEHPLATDFQVGKYYEDGDVLNYIHGQHGEFADDDRVSGVFQCIEVDPKTIPESEWHVEPEKVNQMIKMPRDIPPIVVDKQNNIIDGGHRLAAAVQRRLPKIKVLKQL